jgi:hypothetical protein
MTKTSKTETALKQGLVTEQGEQALTEVLAWLEAGAPHEKGMLRFDMDNGGLEMSCGTVGCMAGAVCQFKKIPDSINWGHYRITSKAAEFCGMSDKLKDQLFYATDKQDGTDMGRGFTLSEVTPEIAAKTLRGFLETGVVKWPARIIGPTQEEREDIYKAAVKELNKAAEKVVRAREGLSEQKV